MRLTFSLLIPFVALAISGRHETAASGGSSAEVRGVAPKDAHLYEVADPEGTWKCRSGQKIPASAINDDYCDCEDGSDEPGTSACANSTFFCRNEGHIPASILSSRVNDGICDPECCDGTDEYDGKVKCPNVCSKVGKAYRKKRQEAENIQRAGSKVRDKYISERKKALEGLTAEIAKLEVELEVAQEKERKAKATLDAAEAMDSKVIAQKKASPLYGTLKSHQEALQILMERQSNMKREMEKLTNLLDDLSKGYNPNYQDMAVKGAVMAYRSWRRGGGEVKESDEDSKDEKEAAGVIDIDDDEAIKMKQLFEEGDWTADKVNEMIDKDLLTLLDDENFQGTSTTHESGILFRIHEYLPDAVVPYFEAGVDTLLDLLLKANIISNVKRTTRKNVDEGEPENVSAARTHHRAADSTLKNVQSSLEEKRKDVDPNPERWGRQGEFKSLDGTCVEKNMGEYTYEFCFFGKALQKPNRGHGNVALGHFKTFAPKNDSVSWQQDEYYLRAIYDSGQRCWNGPERSLIVDFSCGTENALLDVFEGEKCIYEAKVITPAVCWPLQPPAAAHPNVKEEL
ncbi:hypothetical protein CBS101457_000067 [Exobasidium rhododendri]|nr:hypothetical protein CBS101457_000067 [Exobasidium rhododendri]